jgi:hypothetical protein
MMAILTGVRWNLSVVLTTPSLESQRQVTPCRASAVGCALNASGSARSSGGVVFSSSCLASVGCQGLLSVSLHVLLDSGTHCLGLFMAEKFSTEKASEVQRCLGGCRRHLLGTVPPEI